MSVIKLIITSKLQTYPLLSAPQKCSRPLNIFSLLTVMMLYFVSMGHWRNTAQKKVFCFLVPVCSLGLQVPAPMSGFSSINGFSNIWFLQCQQHLVASSLSWHFPQVHFLFYSFLQHPWAWIHRKFQGVLSEMPWQWLVCQSVRHSCALSNKVWI